MEIVGGLIVFLALCHVTNEALLDLNDVDEMASVAKRQLKAMFNEFSKILKNKNIPENLIDDACIQQDFVGTLRNVVQCATKVFKSYMETFIKYDVFKDRVAKKEALQTFRAYLKVMREHRYFGRDDVIPLADAYDAMIRFFGLGDYLNYSQEKFREKY